MESAPLVHWETLEYEHHHKSPDWYWAVSLVAIAFFASAIYLENYLFAVIILLSLFCIFMFSVRRPSIIHVSIEEDGIHIGPEFYPYRAFKGFCIEKKRSREKLLLQSKKTVSPLLSIIIEGVSGREVQEALLPHLPEMELHEPFVHELMEHIGF